MKLIIQKNRYTKGEIIKILREWTGKTQKEFAHDIGKSMNSIQTLLDIVKKNGLVITIEKKK